jgi:rare lipoprotein A
MTAAHPILPIPSYARVTNLQTGKAVVVKINDRGPFHSERLIDLSYTAAYKLGVLAGGRARVEVETVLPGAGDPFDPIWALANAPAAATPLPSTVNAQATPATPVPPAGADAPEARTSVPVVTERSGVFLQLGAFGSRDNAENYLTRLRTDLEWLAPVLHVHTKDGFFRVHAGPYASTAQARVAADRIGLALGLSPIVLTR